MMTDIEMKLSEHQFWRWRAIDLLGGACAECGCKDKRCLELDHKDGDGYLLPSRWKAGTGRGGNRGMTSADIRKLIDSGDLWVKVQVLCSNHHSIKTFEEKEFKKRSGVQGALPLLVWGLA